MPMGEKQRRLEALQKLIHEKEEAQESRGQEA